MHGPVIVSRIIDVPSIPAPLFMQEPGALLKLDISWFQMFQGQLQMVSKLKV